MTTITYVATREPAIKSRLGDEQQFIIPTLNEFTPPEVIFNRQYAASMDGRSGKGTLISAYETSTLGITVTLPKRAYFYEMVYSLADYQIAEIDATDVPYVEAVRQFVMIGNNFTKETKGCTHISGTLQIRFID